MANFDDVQVGDTVVVPVTAASGSGRYAKFSKTFFLQHKVTKITKTQFTVNGNRYMKRDGFRIGASGRVVKVGDFCNGQTVPNQSQEKQLSVYRDAIKIVEKHRYTNLDAFKPTHAISLEKAIEVSQKIDELITLFEEV